MRMKLALKRLKLAAAPKKSWTNWSARSAHFPLKSSSYLFFQVMTGQTEGAPAAGGPGTGGCANSLTCGGVGLGGLGSARFHPWYHFDETGDLKPEYKYWSLNNG